MAHTCKKCGMEFESKKKLDLHSGLEHGEDNWATFWQADRKFFSLDFSLGGELGALFKKRKK
jgi:hypothetical protein